MKKTGPNCGRHGKWRKEKHCDDPKCPRGMVWVCGVCGRAP